MWTHWLFKAPPRSQSHGLQPSMSLLRPQCSGWKHTHKHTDVSLSRFLTYRLFNAGRGNYSGFFTPPYTLSHTHTETHTHNLTHTHTHTHTNPHTQDHPQFPSSSSSHTQYFLLSNHFKHHDTILSNLYIWSAALSGRGTHRHTHTVFD